MGIRVELHVTEIDGCEILSTMPEDAPSISSISWSNTRNGEGVVEEFTANQNLEKVNGRATEIVYETDDQIRHRFNRTRENCICRTIEKLGVPIETVRPVDGGLLLSLYAVDIAEVHEIMRELRGTYDGVELRRLHESGALERSDPVWVDLARLTERQQEVLETAHEMGYFDHPKRADGAEVAAALGIDPSTFSEHISVTQKKIFSGLLVE